MTASDVLVALARTFARMGAVVEECKPEEMLSWKLADALEAKDAEIERLQERLSKKVIEVSRADAKIGELQDEVEFLQTDAGQMHADMYGMQDGSLLRDERSRADRAEAQQDRAVEALGDDSLVEDALDKVAEAVTDGWDRREFEIAATAIRIYRATLASLQQDQHNG